MRHLVAGLLAAGLTATAAGLFPAIAHGTPPTRVKVAYSPEDEALRARLAGTTIRAEVWDGFLQQNHIHRFRADGTVDGEFTARRLIRRDIDFIHEYDRGRWRVENGRLCVSWRKFFLGRPQCYTLTPTTVGWVRFANAGGGPSFNAQVNETRY